MNTILKINLILIFLFKTGFCEPYSKDSFTNQYLLSIDFDYEFLQEIPLFSVDPTVNQNYRKLVYGEGFPNTQSFLEYRALTISLFLIEGDSMKIPEYIVVINRCIEHINKAIKNIQFYNGKRKKENLDFRLNVLKKLVHRLKEWRIRDNFPYNLTYQEVIDFLTKTAIFTQRNNRDQLSFRQGSLSYYILNDILNENEYFDLSYFSLDRYYLGFPYNHEYPYAYEKLLKKIKKPVLLPPFNFQESRRQTWPFTSNTAS